MHVLTLKEGFYLAASHRQIKKSILCTANVQFLKFLLSIFRLQVVKAL
jgi:hypothetical protein